MASQQLRQDMRQSLKLSSSLTQSIKTLQLSSLELEEYINSQLVENPFLNSEIIEDEDSRPLYDRKLNTKNYFLENSDITQTIENEITFMEFLYKQISQEFVHENDKIIASYISDLLDDAGYLRIPFDEICSVLGENLEKIAEIHGKLTRFEPSGVYARDLAECLEIQLKEKSIFNNTYKVILANLDMLGKFETGKLSKLAKVSESEILNAIEIIKKLEPKPARNFNKETLFFKIPDVAIKIDSQNNIVISSKNNSQKVIINKDLYESVKKKTSRDEDKNYTHEMYKSASNLVKSVEMRVKTILLVAEAIAREQEEFFKRGILYLKPLTLSKIAEITGHDESTISRATSNKYVETPYGVLEMKYFFSSGVRSKYSSEDVSSHKVKELIRSIINDEDKKSPLSDEEIASMLKQFNVVAARRTVAKYREAIRIGSSSERKRQYVKEKV